MELECPVCGRTFAKDTSRQALVARSVHVRRAHPDPEKGQHNWRSGPAKRQASA